MRVRNGVDIVAVARIEKSMKRPGFMARCFSSEEQEPQGVPCRNRGVAVGGQGGLW